MAQKRKRKKGRVRDYRHEDAKRKNNPPAGMVSYEKVSEPEVKHYAYDPHLSPQLIWAGKPGLKSIEVEDACGVEAETVSLHVHERVSTQAIIRAVQRKPKQFDLFADPELPIHEAVKFYQHDVDWANRLILGDSLLVANSLIEREMMAGKVQMIYMDPPYGIKYSSNFQPRIDRRDVKDGDEHLTREPEMIKAYRDTWKLGIHSYLTYMRDRLRVCRDLLADSGSIFVQIGDENMHLVRSLLDEVFGRQNFVAIIPYKTTSGAQQEHAPKRTMDFLLWYSRDAQFVKFRRLYREREANPNIFTSVELADGTRRPIRTAKRSRNTDGSLDRVRPFTTLPVHSKSPGHRQPREFQGRSWGIPAGSWRYSAEGFRRLAESGRIVALQSALRTVAYFADFAYEELTATWSDTSPELSKAYAVQTSTKVIERCILMTTDPGDLVFDPTCGSGTTAYSAEKWGRRWISCDTSRVALSLARQRLLTATLPHYRIDSDDRDAKNPRAGFVYKTVPHVSLKSIAQNTWIDPVAEKYNPLLEGKLKELNAAIGTKFKEWEVPHKSEKKWSAVARKLHAEFWKLKRDKQGEIDAIIAEDAPEERLYDQPEIVRSVVRVSGPFTVEAIPPPVYDPETPIAGAPEPELVQDEDGSHISTLIELLRKDGVTFPNNKKLKLEGLTARTGGILHAEGEANGKRYAFSFGPRHGPVSLLQVENGLREANLGGYDAVIFCGFAFDPEAQAAIASDPHPNVRAHLSHIRPDVILKDHTGGDLLKTTASSQLFTVFGEPDVKVTKKKDEYTIELLGVDVYDPIEGTVNSESADRVAAWFVDSDYDRRTFCIVQAFFPNKSAWKKLERALKGKLDDDRFEMLTGHTSLPFKVGKHKKAAVKVVDQRGNEVMKVANLG